MNQSPEKVLHYLAGNGNIEAVTVDDLQKLAAENPYFPVTQFLLAKKLKNEGEETYLSQVQKTALYFSNPYWLQYQLDEIDFDKEHGTQSVLSVDPKEANNDSNQQETASKESQPSVSYISGADITLSSNFLHEGTSRVPEVEATEGSDLKFQNTGSTTGQQVVTEETAEIKVTQAEEEHAALRGSPEDTTESFLNNLVPGTQIPPLSASIIIQDLPPAAETEVIDLEEEMAGVMFGPDDLTDKFLEETAHSAPKDEQPEGDEHDRMFQNIKAMLDASSEEADADINDAAIAIDPYYTIDYFASQGIKLELDQNPKDQLGQNLKKFTQWLRHMKKLGPEDATESINKTETEADIQQIADSSNTVREVVTEAMASVLEKQGKKDKAIELYNKLSFLNPDKSAYFADKIKKLKGI